MPGSFFYNGKMCIGKKCTKLCMSQFPFPYLFPFPMPRYPFPLLRFDQVCILISSSISKHGVRRWSQKTAAFGTVFFALCTLIGFIGRRTTLNDITSCLDGVPRQRPSAFAVHIGNLIPIRQPRSASNLLLLLLPLLLANHVLPVRSCC